MTDETPAIAKLHATYVHRSNRELPMDMARMMAWRNWMAKGFTEGDLEAVIALLKRKIAAGQKWPSALYFGRLIEDTAAFEDYLAEARAWVRRPKVDTGKAEVLRLTGRHDYADVLTLSAEQVMEQHALMAKMLAEYKRTL